MDASPRRLVTTLCLVALLLVPAAAGAAFIASFEQLAPLPTSYLRDTEFRLFEGIPGDADDLFVATGGALGALQAADDGCDAGDFAGFVSGRIALIERGLCLFGDKINAAEAAGAIGVVIFDSTASFPVVALNVDTDIPAVFVTDTLGGALAAALALGETRVRIVITAVPEPASLALAALALAMALALNRRRALPARAR